MPNHTVFGKCYLQMSTRTAGPSENFMISYVPLRRRKRQVEWQINLNFKEITWVSYLSGFIVSDLKIAAELREKYRNFM